MSTEGPGGLGSREPPEYRYYCHRCSMYIDIDPETSLCSRCNDGFIERMPSLQTDSFPNILRNITQFLTETPEDPTELQPASERPSGEQGQFAGFIRTVSRRNRSRPSSGRPVSGGPGPLLNFATAFGSLAQNAVVLNLSSDDPLNAQNSPLSEQVEQFIMRALADPRLFNSRSSEAIINRLVHTPLSEERFEKTNDCPICMEKFIVGSEIVLLGCEHFFHPDCIITWVRMHNTCPVCRSVVD
ncbi:E3 ubiquitin-protein ligase RING1-like protein [Thelohanellus kitauei]|uniref:RING-type E3 ubiquitin transferase n=1 Tax=Thelohanellus kitauei TaxID=669202 RepID=A0A0C2NBK9_THEKT|nr:E3 ubiquitin-protein ligase RING1-like protein [Thelohanellus kitauei]